MFTSEIEQTIEHLQPIEVVGKPYIFSHKNVNKHSVAKINGFSHKVDIYSHNTGFYKRMMRF